MLYIRKPNTNCLICHKAIYRRKSQIIQNQGHVYCSSTCYGISNRKEKECSVCGKLMLKSLNKKTCSRACSNINRSGIKYNKQRKDDKSVQIRSLKLRLIASYGGVCQMCGYDKTPVLQVHHKDKNNQNNNWSNLSLLCPNCHYELHYLENSWLKGII